jgi:hypothetical protein
MNGMQGLNGWSYSNISGLIIKVKVIINGTFRLMGGYCTIKSILRLIYNIAYFCY